MIADASPVERPVLLWQSCVQCLQADRGVDLGVDPGVVAFSD